MEKNIEPYKYESTYSHPKVRHKTVTDLEF